MSVKHHQHRSLGRLALAGLTAGALAFAAGQPATAADGSEILVYTGDNAFNQGYSLFGQAVGLPVVESSSLPADLSDYACIVLPINSTSFSHESTSALVTYVNQGGNLIAVADHVRFAPTAIDTMNTLASAVGASMTLTYQLLGLGNDVTEEIDPSPLTEGVLSIGFGWATGVTLDAGGGAQSLVRTNPASDPQRTTFIAAQSIGVGTFVLSGDSNALSDTSPTRYSNHDNDVLAKNLCLGSLQQYSFEGFFGPVEADAVNTVKGGSTVPLQFRVFDGDTEITDPAVVESFTVTPVVCPDEESPAEEVEFTTTGRTQLRYTDGKFQQNWKTPKTNGCYQVTVATTDGATLTADFVLR